MKSRYTDQCLIFTGRIVLFFFFFFLETFAMFVMISSVNTNILMA